MVEKVNQGIEQKIRNYFNYNAKLDMMMAQLEKKRWEGSPKDIGAIDYSSTSSGTSKRQTAEKVLSDVQKIQQQIQDFKCENKMISSAMQIIKHDNPMEYNFIMKYYHDCKDIMVVATELGYSYNSRNSIYKIKEKVLKKFEEFGL